MRAPSRGLGGEQALSLGAPTCSSVCRRRFALLVRRCPAHPPPPMPGRRCLASRGEDCRTFLRRGRLADSRVG